MERRLRILWWIILSLRNTKARFDKMQTIWCWAIQYIHKFRTIQLTRKGFPYKGPTNENISSTHDTRIQVNKRCMDWFPVKQLIIPKNPRNYKSQDVHLGEGMPVIVHKTNKKLNTLHSDKFTVKSIQEKKIDFINDFCTFEISPSLFQKYFYFAFCTTILSREGATIAEKFTIHDWRATSHVSDGTKLQYVALSRGTHKSNIQICDHD